MQLQQMAVLAFLIEAVWESGKLAWQNGRFCWDRAGVLLLAMALCALSGANLFAALGLRMGPHAVGCLFTGVLLSRGSNFLHDLLGKVQA